MTNKEYNGYELDTDLNIEGKDMKRLSDTDLGNIADEFKRLSLAILWQARKDAEKGNLEAILWLLSTGAFFADALVEDGSQSLFNFCKQTFEKIQDGEIEPLYENDATSAKQAVRSIQTNLWLSDLTL